MLKNISMRHLLPLLLLGGGLLFVLFFYSFSLPAAKKQALELSKQQTHTLLQAQQGRFTELLMRESGQQLDQEIYFASTDINTYRFLILDEHNRIVYGNRSRLLGQHINDVDLPIKEEMLAKVSITRTILLDTPTNETSRYLTGYATLPIQRDGRIQLWHLVVVRDYKRMADAVVTIASYPSELLATFLLFVAVLAIILLRQHLDARIQPILSAASRLARGEKNVSTGLSGKDEFSEIASSFDQMASRIDANKVELELAKDNAEKANAAKNHFLSHMSHEIQTPLTTILGFLDLLKDTKLDSDGSLYVHTMETSTRTLSHLMGDLLETNRLEAGTITPRPQPFCLNTVVQETLDTLLPRAREKGISIKVTSNESNPIWLDSDARIFRQILLNLVGNAIQYTQSGSVTIVLECLSKTSDEINLRICVVDTGIGINEKDLPYIFERFYRSDDPLVREQKGAGIGLTICKDFVQLLHGDLSVESHESQGSTFMFSCRVAVAPPEANFDFADLSMREQKSLNILLVENTPVTQVLFKSILEKAGHNVEICSTAQPAIDYVKERLIYPHKSPISLIVMDIHLPKIDGFQATEEIRGLGGPFASIPILATSTQDDPSIKERCLKGLFDGFILKPINKQYLIEEIFRLTQLASNEDKEGEEEPTA